MIISVSFCTEYPPGIMKYHITYFGNEVKVLPDLMKIRFYNSTYQYVNNGLVNTTHDEYLPKVDDVVEWDIKKDEWFIVRNITNEGEINARYKTLFSS